MGDPQNEASDEETMGAEEALQEELLKFFAECEKEGKGEMPCTACFQEGGHRRRFRPKGFKPHYDVVHRHIMRNKNRRTECVYCKNWFLSESIYYEHKRTFHPNQ